MSTGNELVTLKQVNNYYKDLRKRSAPVIFNNAVGNPAVFSDGADGLPIQSLTVHLLPRQEGTGDPSPENKRSIVGWTGCDVYAGGKNLIASTGYSGSFYVSSKGTSLKTTSQYVSVVENDNEVTVTATYDWCGAVWATPLLPPGTYRLKLETSDTNFRGTIYKTDADLKTIESGTQYSSSINTSITLTTPARIALWIGMMSYTSVTVSNIQLEAGSSASSYVPYAPIALTDIVFPATGKNLLYPSRRVVSGNNVQYYRTGNKFPLKGGQTYTISTNITPSQISIFKGTNTPVTSTTSATLTYTPTEDVEVWIDIYVTNSRLPDGGIGAVYGMLELGDTAHSYEPYTNTFYGVSLNLTTGALTVEWAGFSATWGDFSSATDMGSGITRKIFPMVDNLTTGFANNMCNIAPYSSNENASIHYYYSGSGSTNRNCRLFLPSDTPDSTEITVITKLSQTYEIQLTPQQITTLLGNNTIWSDANGDIEVEYRADTKLFFQKNDTVDDVKVNNVSVVQNGVANIPIATSNNFGVIRTVADYGLNMTTVGQYAGVPYIAKSTSDGIKGGASQYRPIVPYNQHESAFYALAKLAGADMANSSNAVGTYTDAALEAIQKLFGLDGVLGDFESSATTSKAYAIGETFIHNGKRYRATAAIAINDIIAPGTNCALDPLDGKYVRNTDYASTSAAGLAKGSSTYGTSAIDSDGTIMVYQASANDIKAGTHNYRPIVPSKQHESAFYGLAKAAGDTSQASSSNAVGVYTADAKTAILAMLGVTIASSSAAQEIISSFTPAWTNASGVSF